MKGSWLNDNIKALGALIIIIGVIAYLFMVTIISKDTTVRSQALIAIVGLGGSVAGYYYGYSQGASKKDDALTSLANQPTVANADTINVDQTIK